MLKKPKQNEQTAFPDFKNQPEQIQDALVKQRSKKAEGFEPPNLGKAIRLPVPHFSNPNRPPVCLEQDFPIVSINALSSLEGNADKRFTKSLMMAAQATGISFFDHIIIGDNRYFSFADEGLIGEYKAVAVREL
jgi:hypothetical protein